MQKRKLTPSGVKNIFKPTQYIADLKHYLKLSWANEHNEFCDIILDPDSDCLYNITFYDVECDKFITVIAMITGVSEAFIDIKYITGLCNICPCSYKDILVKFVDCKKVSINIGYISSISLYEIEKPKMCKEVTKVALLGISSEIIQSVVVRLRLYEDDCCCEVTGATIVDMKVGGHYQVDYIDHSDHTNYQICGILKEITVQPNFGDETPENGIVRSERHGCNHHDQIGMGNTMYDSFDDIKEEYDRDHFFNLSKNPPERILFVFDTSTQYNSTIDKIWLTDIRGVIMIDDVENDIQDPNNPTYGEDINLPPEPDCLGKCCDYNPSTSGGCKRHGGCCHYANFEEPPFPPPYANDTIDAGEWTFYIDRAMCNACGKNNTTGEIRHNISIEELLEFYANHTVSE